MSKRAVSLLTPGIWISSIYFHINQTRAVVWPVGITSPSSTVCIFWHLSEINIFHLPFSRTDCTNIFSITGSGHYQKYKKTLLISLVSVDPEWGRTEREQNVLFNKRITYWKNISSYNSFNTRGETLQIWLKVFKRSDVKFISIHFLLRTVRELFLFFFFFTVTTYHQYLPQLRLYTAKSFAQFLYSRMASSLFYSGVESVEIAFPVI